MAMDITEIRDALTRMINHGYSNHRLIDQNDPNFAICAISEELGEIVFEVDEIK